MVVRPCTIVNPGYRVNRNSVVNSRTIVSGGMHVKGGGRICPGTIVNRSPRSLGFTNRCDAIIVNGSGDFHRFIAVRHTAKRGYRAHVNSRGVLRTCARITRGYGLKSCVIVSDFSKTTNRIAIRSRTIVNNVDNVRRFMGVNTYTVINNVSGVMRSMYPFIVISNGPTEIIKLGDMKLTEGGVAPRMED